MSRYIDANLLFVDLWDNSEAWRDSEMGYTVEQVKNTPTANVQVVKHGYWVNKSYAEIQHKFVWCSICDNENLISTPYCPWCGAKMDGGENNV